MTRMRYATQSDERALAAIDRETWSPRNSPVPLWTEDVNFFSCTEPGDVVVALRPRTRVVTGLAIDDVIG
jgi:hypothetical protein